MARLNEDFDLFVDYEGPIEAIIEYPNFPCEVKMKMFSKNLTQNLNPTKNKGACYFKS